MIAGEPTDEMWEEIEVTFTDVQRTHWAFKYVALASVGFDGLPEEGDTE